MLLKALGTQNMRLDAQDTGLGVQDVGLGAEDTGWVLHIPWVLPTGLGA